MIRRLLLSALLASTISAAPARDALPPLPKYVESQRGRIEIEYVTGKLDCGGIDAWGCYDVTNRRVFILAGRPLEATWHTIEHEKVHVIFRDNGVVFSDMAVEQRFCDIIAAARVHEMLAQH